MTTDLYMLTWTTVWLTILVFVPAMGRAAVAGLPWGFSNRETVPEVPPWIDRADRASKNMLENFVPFAALVLIAQLTGSANETTANSTMVFLAARIAHGVSYILGITYLRTLAFFIGLYAEVRILFQLL